MKKLVLLFSALLLCGAAFAQGPSLTLVNNTGYTIRYLYVSSNTSDSWEDDVLGRRVLEDGDSFNLSLPENGTYDFKAVDEDDDTYIKWNVIVRGNQTITFTMSDFENEGGLEDDEQPYVTNSTPSSGTWVTVSNQTGYSIYYLYVSPGEADSWGRDILGEDTLSNGEEVRVVLPSGAGPFDFRAKDVDDDEYTRYDVEMQRGSNRMVFRLSDMD